MDDGSRVIPLAQLQGFRIANGALDMRLWQVHSGDGKWIGTVDELLVDTATMEVRYLDVEVENLLVTGRERHVLIPIGHARPDAKLSSTVVVDGLAARAVARLPDYDRGAVLAGTGAEYVLPFAGAWDPSSEKLDFPIRVEAPRLTLRSDATSGHLNRKLVIVAVGATESAEPSMQLATDAVHVSEPRAA